MSSLAIWPAGVGYDRRSAYNEEGYRAAQGDLIEKVEQLIRSWRNEALAHGFSCENTQVLACTLDNEGGTGHQFTFLNEQSGKCTVHCRIETVSASADVDEDPSDTFMTLKVSGTDIDENRIFDYKLTVYRSPITVYSSYIGAI